MHPAWWSPPVPRCQCHHHGFAGHHPLERQFGQISGLELMTSDSSAGLSTIILQFSMDRDIDIAAQDVQAAIRQATLPSSLPYQPVYNR